MDLPQHNAAIRKAAFDFSEDHVACYGEIPPRHVLAKRFEWQGRRVPLVSAQGSV